MQTVKRLRWITLGVVIGLAFGGIAYAVVVNPPNAADRYYACVSSGGIVRSDTIRRNVPPTKCSGRTDTIESWNAVGTTGPTGATGAPGAGGSAFRTYVGTYTVRHTNTGCAANEVRLELVTVAGRTPTDPYGPCGGLYPCYGVNGDDCNMIIGDPLIVGATANGSVTIGSQPTSRCFPYATELGLPADYSIELETWNRNTGTRGYNAILFDPTSFDYGITWGLPALVSNPLSDPLCSQARGNWLGSPFPSLAGSTSSTAGNRTWSIYTIAANGV